MKTWQKLKKNSKLWQKFFIREKIIQAVREFFIRNNFHEVETPILVPSVIPESYLEYFSTDLIDRQNRKMKMFLTTSPESSLKKLLAAGIGNCFEITKSFRNTETDSLLHNPEFTILEWYRVGADYNDIMKDCEKLLKYIYKKLQPVPESRNRFLITYRNRSINLSTPWTKISVIQALKTFSNIDFDAITDQKSGASGNKFPVSKIAGIAKSKGYQVQPYDTWEILFNQIFLNEIEPQIAKLSKPVIIYDYPAPLAALAAIKQEDRRIAERFELYAGGLELADCYTELTDYPEQKIRFEIELKVRRKMNKSAVYPDEDFLGALNSGLPHCSGIAMGLDRLVMLFTDSKTIQETILFPVADLISV